MSGHSTGGRKLFLKLLSTTRGKIIFCAGGLLLSVMILWIEFGGEIGTLLPGPARIDALNRELKKNLAAEAELNARLEVREAIRRAAEKQIADAWSTAKYGEAEVELRAKVEKAAKDQELKLGNISTVRTTKFNNDLSFLELDVNVSADLEQVVKFIAAIHAVEPKLYWRRLDFRPDNFSGTGSLMFNGTLRCLSDERAAQSAAAVKSASSGAAASAATRAASTPPGSPAGMSQTTPPGPPSGAPGGGTSGEASGNGGAPDGMTGGGASDGGPGLPPEGAEEMP